MIHEQLNFDITYGKYLKRTYPTLYHKGIELAAKKHYNPRSIAAFLYAIGYVQGYLEACKQNYSTELH